MKEPRKAPQARRIGEIIKIIARNPGLKLSQLERELGNAGMGVSRKTITKDVEFIKNELALLPNRPRLKRGYVLSDVMTLGADEVGIVLDAVNAFSQNLQDPATERVARRLQDVARQGTKSLAPTKTERTGLRQRQIYELTKEQQHTDSLLMTAMERRLPVSILYRSPWGEQNAFVAYPVWKVFHERGWYYVNRKNDANAFYSWRLDRIVDCKLLSSPLNVTHGEDLLIAKTLVVHGWGMSFPPTMESLTDATQLTKIVVQFDSTVAPFIKEGRQRHPKCRITMAKDGSGAVEFSIFLPKECHMEFRQWVRSWGAAARFMEPVSFVEAERTEIIRLVKLYQM